MFKFPAITLGLLILLFLAYLAGVKWPGFGGKLVRMGG